MTRRAVATVVVLLTVAVGIASVAVKSCAHRRTERLAEGHARAGRPPDGSVRARLRDIPLYRTLAGAEALRSGSVSGDGTLHLEIDPRALAEPRLAAAGLAGASEMLPVSARGTIATESTAGTPPVRAFRESWSLDGPAALLDLLDRSATGRPATLALDALPGAPTAVVCVRLMPERLADPSLGGAAFASWRDRATFAEKLLGRPLRAEIAEDLAGPAVFALYDSGDAAEAEAVAVVELRRSDRLAGLLDMLFGLGALAERVSVRRYRGVATGSFRSESGGPAVALAVDGPLLVVATSRARLESTIDARRSVKHLRGGVAAVADPSAPWSAVSESSFVAHGWARLARSADEPITRGARTFAALRADGATGWLLEAHGAGPAVGADPVVPFLRSVFDGRQRDGD
jgi:hypothetical protein